MGFMRWMYSDLWKQEAKDLLVVAWPVVVSNFLFNFPVMVSMLFAGTQGTEIMDAVALALTFVNLTGTSVGMGLTTAFDTLLSQTFGGANKKRVGAIVQRGILIIMLFCFPCWAFYLNIEGVMVALGEPPDVSQIGGRYVMVFIPGLPGLIWFQIISKYLQNQNIVRPPMIAAIFLNIANAGYHALFLFVLHWKAEGAAAALALAYWTADIALLLYIKIRGIHKETWGGWTLDALQEWGTFTKLAIPGLLMMALEFWNYEIGTLLAGRLGKKPLAAQAIIYQFVNMAFMVPFGMSIGSSIRIGQHLGEGRPKLAKVAARLSVTFISFTALGTLIIYQSCRWLIPYLFTGDPDIVKTTAMLFLLIGVSTFFDSYQGVCSGILRGCGRQRLGVVVNFIGFYVIGLPTGLTLMLKTDLGVAGFWIGTIFGVMFQAFTFNIIVALTNWPLESELAKKRAGIKTKEQKALQAGDEVKSDTGADGKDMADGVKAPAVRYDSHGQVIVETDQESVTTIERLPIKTLIFRRALIFLLMFSILLVGIALRYIIKLPEPNPNDTHGGHHSGARPLGELMLSALWGPIVPHDEW